MSGNKQRVIMPSNQEVEVTEPAKPCDCYGNCTFVRVDMLSPTGHELNIVKHEMNNTIKKHNNSRGGVYSRFEILEVKKISNPCLWKKYKNKQAVLKQSGNGNVNEKILFHGTSSAETIAKKGFNLDKADKDNMFGRAIYFAKNSSKSNQYVYSDMNQIGCPNHRDRSCYSCKRQMLLCRVSLGRMHVKTAAEKLSKPPQGYHSIVGKPDPDGLRYYEYAVYDADQIYPEYLVTYKLVR